MGSYHEIMDKIELSEDARRRILDNISKSDYARSRPKVISLSSFRRFTAAAAMFAVIIAGTFAWQHMNAPSETTDPGTVETIPMIDEVSTLKELEEKVGFSVETLTVLPFVVEETVYTSYWDEMAEITYSGDGQTAIFRKKAGSEDVSGDYNEYGDIVSITAGGIEVTLKGNDEQYVLALWEADGYSYSLGLSDGLTRSAFGEIMESFVGNDEKF